MWGWILGGSIGGFLAALAWAGIYVSSGYEMGIVAWILGALVGIGVRIGSCDNYGVPIGLTAVAISILSITFARFLMILHDTHNVLISFVASICIWLATDQRLGFYNILWIGLACFTAFRVSMNDRE